MCGVGCKDISVQKKRKYNHFKLFSPLFLEAHWFGMFSMLIFSNHGTNHIPYKYIKKHLTREMHCPVTFKLQRPRSVIITQSKHEEETHFTVGPHMGFCCGLGGSFFYFVSADPFFWLVGFFSKPLLIFYMIKKLYLLTNH